MFKNQTTQIVTTNSEITTMDSHSHNHLEKSSSIVSELYYKTYKTKAIKMQTMIQDYIERNELQSNPKRALQGKK